MNPIYSATAIKSKVTAVIITTTSKFAYFAVKVFNLQIVSCFNAASSVIRRLDPNNL